MRVGAGMWFRVCLLLATLALACGGRQTTPTGGGETNWLHDCTTAADCPSADCVCGSCTVACSDVAGCAAGPPKSTCAVAGSSALAAMCGASPLPAGACLPTCGGGCASGSVCVGDYCVPVREPATDGAAGAGGSGGTSGDSGGAGGCSPETDATFCARRGKNCGSVTGADNCGTPRTVGSCGTCASPQICGGTNVCISPDAGGSVDASDADAGDADGPMVVDWCSGQTPQRPLPYVVATDFSYAVDITSVVATDVLRWKQIANPDCNGSFPDAGPADAAADASVDASPVTDAAPPIPACWAFYYNPDNCVNAVNDDGGAFGGQPWVCWAGTFFKTTPAGDAPAGICIADGATSVEFWARASRDQARVKIGSTAAGEGTYEFWFSITTTWAKYSIPVLPGYRSSTTPYGVSIGFSIVVEPQDHPGGTYIYVKDMTWVGPGGG
jgi:hypothetical protein